MSRQFYSDVASKSKMFYCIECEIMGYKCELYNYRQALYDDFESNNAFEMRGLTFIYDGSSWRKFFALNKFFNINEVPMLKYSDLMDQTILYTQEKLDGSMISFVQFPNGNVLAKSKMSFESYQAIIAQEIYESSENLRIFVNKMMEQNMNPIFELTSEMNQIVVQYYETNLTLLHVRDSEGIYSTIDDMKTMGETFGIKIVKPVDHTLEELMGIQVSSREDIEGFVVTFSDGRMVKVKTKSYVQKHGVVSDIRANDIIRLIIDGKIDDVVSILNVNSEKRRYLENVTTLILANYHDIFNEIMDLYTTHSEMTPKELSGVFLGSKWFHIIMKIHKLKSPNLENQLEKLVKTFIRKSTSKLLDAQKYIKNLSIN